MSIFQVFLWLPAPVVAVLFVLAVTVPAVAGCLLVHRYVPVGRRRLNNDVAGPLSSMVGIVYAVILAFVAIAVWEQFGAAEALVQREASAAGDIGRQAEGYPEPLRTQVKTAMRAYVESVISEEWPLQQRGRTTTRPWEIFERAHTEVLHFEPQTKGQEAVHAEQLRDFNVLMDQRRARLHAAHQGIDPRVWSVMIAGTAIMVAFTWFFGTESFRAHLLMTTLFGIAIGLVVYMVAELDYPFRGGTGVQPDSFQEVLDNMNRLSGRSR
ncbi:MAG TPA: hypothetical protein VEA38_17870 [Terriglobales bacterium]|nr:hypothetical protein [Terriglobales bacterium]